MKYILASGLLALSACGCNEAYQSSSGNAPPSGNVSTVNAPDRDNTTVNDRDRNATTKTPLDQNENSTDIDITAGIRKRVVDTKMSLNAQNVKIITQDGRVTLRGPVKTADEKMRIEEIARAVAGDGNVDSQLEIEKS